MITTVKYIGHECGTILGCAIFTDISEVLIPDFKVNKHDVYMRHCFKNEPGITLWKVTDLKTDGGEISIYVLGMDSSDSLGHFAKKQYRKPATILRNNQYQLVEVEFGFQQDVFSDTSKSRNENFSVALMPGELHKKRPCIVIHCEDEKAQVIPLTSQPSIRHPKQLLISDESFKDLSVRYTKNNSAALISMIQTVSVFRIYPMKNKDGHYRNDYANHKLCQLDKKALIELLGKTYSSATLRDNSSLTKRIDSLNKEKKRLLQNQVELNENLSITCDEKLVYENRIKEVAKYLEIDGSLEDILKAISKLN